MICSTRRFLGRLGTDATGNTLALVAAALLPITAMIGSGLDMSRAYMAKSRLQSACDAASLAARREMKNDVLSTEVIDTGKKFFNFNFAQGSFQTQAFEPQISKPEVGVVRIEASTRIPTTIMQLFGFSTLPLNVSCDASLNFVNTDVVLVLDVTGSMSQSAGGTSRIEALREAVMALYDELAPVQEQLESQGLRLRYSIVPYSSTVNVGRLIYNVNPSYIRDQTPYQTRVANHDTPTYRVTGSDSTRVSQTYGQLLSSSQCASYGRNQNYPNLNGSGPFVVSGSPQSGRQVTRTYEFRDWGGTGTTRGNNRTCRRWMVETTTTYDTTPRYEASSWSYQEATLDTSDFKRPGATIRLATNLQGTMPSPGVYNALEMVTRGSGYSTTSPLSWNGCIEERDTVPSITPSANLSIPSDAFDLDIDRIPDSDATRWRPMLPQAVYQRTAGSTSATTGSTPSTACPAEARRLTRWSRDEMQAYVNGLQPVGGTYHDVGMIWGARFISTGGIFADGCEEFNRMPCNRHVIFMTDGQQTAYCNVYTAYGVERNDMRVRGGTNCTSDTYNNDVPTSPATADLLARHEQRFRMACNATKNINASVWVIAFATDLNDNLTGCASNRNQASTSSNREELITRFREIGNQIGALRLTK